MTKLKLCVLGAGLLLGACAKTSSETPSAESRKEEAKHEAKLCKNMDKLKSEVINYPDVTPETQLSTIQEANSHVEKAVKEVKESAKDVNNPRIVEVQTSYQKLQETLNTVPSGTMTVGERSEEIRTDAQAFRDSWNRLYDSMECGAGA